MVKRMFVAVLFVMGMFFSISANAMNTSVGGHVKLTLFDAMSGEHNTVSSSQYSGLGFREMILYIYSELSDKVSVDLQPMFSASTGATPKFGKDIGQQKKAASAVSASFEGWAKAVVKAVLPYDLEVSVGLLRPMFTMEYGGELFWGDEYNGSKFAANPYLGALEDAGGIEIYKSIEYGNITLPAYLYILNGGGAYSDNNNSPTFMLNVEPEIGALKLSGSFLYGMYNDGDTLSEMRWSAEAAYTLNKFAIRGGFAGGNWKKSISGVDDAKPMGYYVKAFYNVTSWARAMLHYNYVKNNYTGFFYTAKGEETYTTITPGLQITVAPSSKIEMQYDIANWKQTGRFGVSSQKDTIKFNRFTVGWRTTF